MPQETPERAKSQEDALEIFAATRQMDSAYERFRNLLDPGDEDILRRKAIVRFLRLRWDVYKDSEKLAFSLLKNLARGRYIPQDTSLAYTKKIASVVDKSNLFWRLNNKNLPKWLLPMTAVEIDRLIYPREGDDALVYVFYQDMERKVRWLDTSIPDEDKNTQLFLACHRVLAKTDEAELFWHLYRTAEPAWDSSYTEETMRGAVKRFETLQAEIEAALHSNVAVRVLRRLHAPAVPYRILREVLREKNAGQIIQNPDLLGQSVRDVLARRIRHTEKQMLSRVWHAAAFLFLTKGVLAVATEIPYEMILGGVRVVPLLINLLFPPTLLFLMAGSVPRPGKDNAERLVNVIKGIISGDDSTPEVVIRAKESGALRGTIFAVIYGLATLISLTIILYVLNLLDFSLIGGFYFVIFLALVSFLGLRLRSSMREFRVVSLKQSGLGLLADFFTVPIIDFGREISLRASQINIFLFLMDAIIEAPFKLLIGIVEEWFSYIRERKEELV